VLGGRDASQEEDAGEDINNIKRQKSRKKHFAKKGHFWDLIIVDIIPPYSLTCNKLSDIVAVEVQEDGHGSKKGGTKDDSNGAKDERPCAGGDTKTARTKDHHLWLQDLTRKL